MQRQVLDRLDAWADGIEIDGEEPIGEKTISEALVVLRADVLVKRPVRGADVAIMRGQSVKLAEETDSSGIAAFDLGPGDYARYFQDYEKKWKDHIRIRASYGLDTIEFMPNGSHNPYRSGVYAVGSPLDAGIAKMETLLFTDRGLYRPGEKIWFRGIDLNSYRAS